MKITSFKKFIQSDIVLSQAIMVVVYKLSCRQTCVLSSSFCSRDRKPYGLEERSDSQAERPRNRFHSAVSEVIVLLHIQMTALHSEMHVLDVVVL